MFSARPRLALCVPMYTVFKHQKNYSIAQSEVLTNSRHMACPLGIKFGHLAVAWQW